MKVNVTDNIHVWSRFTAIGIILVLLVLQHFWPTDATAITQARDIILGIIVGDWSRPYMGAAYAKLTGRTGPTSEEESKTEEETPNAV